MTKLRFAAYGLLISSVILAFWYLYFGNFLDGNIFSPDPEEAKSIHPFMTGLVLPLLTLGSTLLVIETLRTNTTQNFNSNFFKLIDHHHKLVDGVVSEVYGISKKNQPSKGKVFFDDVAELIARDYFKLSGIASDKSHTVDSQLEILCKEKMGRDLLVAIYDHHFHVYQSDLGHYFRNLYHLVKFVHNSNVKDKKEYLSMLRAQLSNYELLLLAYNGLHPYGDKFYPLIEEYELLKSLNNETRLPASFDKRIIDINVLIEAYPHLGHWRPKVISV